MENVLCGELKSNQTFICVGREHGKVDSLLLIGLISNPRAPSSLWRNACAGIFHLKWIKGHWDV